MRFAHFSKREIERRHDFNAILRILKVFTFACRLVRLSHSPREKQEWCFWGFFGASQLWGGSRLRFIIPTLQAYYNCIGRARYIQCVKYMSPDRDGRTPVDVSGFTKAPSLFTVESAVARRINGLIKHAILPVMQFLSTSRRRERERLHSSRTTIVPSCASGRSCGRISPAPLLCARLHSILARNAHVEAALWEINVLYAKRVIGS